MAAPKAESARAGPSGPGAHAEVSVEVEKPGTHADVLVVGGGPAGSVAAYLLARAGFRVTLLEASARPRRKICGEFLGFAGVEALRRVGLAHILSDEDFPPAHGAEIISPGGMAISGLFPQVAADPAMALAGGYCLDRARFDAALLSAARQGGARIIRGERVTGLGAQSGGERVSAPNPQLGGWTVQTLSGKCFSCDLLIGADGAQSFVARALGLTRPEVFPRRVALRCFLPTRRKNRRLIEMHLLERGSYIGIDAVSETEVNFSIVADTADLKAHGGAEGLFRFHYERCPALRENVVFPDPFPPIDSVAPVRHAVKSPVARNAALIGDAAGSIEPLTGEGITNALWQAELLAGCLVACKMRGRWANRNEALRAYARRKFLRELQKAPLRDMLLWLIRHERIIDGICRRLQHRPRCVMAFMGIVNNTWPPLIGLGRLLIGLFSAPESAHQTMAAGRASFSGRLPAGTSWAQPR